MSDRVSKRMDKLEQSASPLMRIVHMFPGMTEGKALAAHKRAHGPIPADAKVVVIHHTFKSRI